MKLRTHYLSYIYMLLRIAFPLAVANCHTQFEAFQHKWIIAGIFHIGLGMVFNILRPTLSQEVNRIYTVMDCFHNCKLYIVFRH